MWKADLVQRGRKQKSSSDTCGTPSHQPSCSEHPQNKEHTYLDQAVFGAAHQADPRPREVMEVRVLHCDVVGLGA